MQNLLFGGNWKIYQIWFDRFRGIMLKCTQKFLVDMLFIAECRGFLAVMSWFRLRLRIK